MATESGYKPVHRTDSNASESLPLTIGRGTGMTIRELKRRIQESEKRRGVGCQRWRLKQRFVIPRRVPRAIKEKA